MRILLLSPSFPWPPFGGALIRAFETIRHLSQRHRVTLLAPVEPEPSAERLSMLESLCEAVVTVPVSETSGAVFRRLATGLARGMPLIQGLHYDGRLARQLRQLTSEHEYDVIHVEHSYMAPYLREVSARCRAKKILSMPDVESLRFQREMTVAPWGTRRLALLGNHHLFGSWEPQALRLFDGIATVSEFERTWVRALAPGAEVAVVPNGVNVDYFAPAGRHASVRSIVFPGLMNYPPNIDAVSWFCKAILPMVARRFPAVTFSIVGDKPTAAVRALAQIRGVEVTGRVADIRPYLENCAAVVVPLRSGAGTRLKILEAMAMRRPVVTTVQGADGLDVTAGVHLLIGKTPNEFADHLCALFSQPLLADRLGRAGRRLVETTYDWSLCLRSLDALYDAVTAPREERAFEELAR